MRKNAEVAKILYEIADLLELQDVQWKPQAYRKAAQTIESWQEDIETVVKEGRVEALPGVGTHIAEKVKEIVATGTLDYLKRLKKQIPIDVESLSEIEGLGPKTLKLLYKKLHVKTLKDLKRVATKRKIRKIKGMGEKKEHMILESVEHVEKRGPKRFLLGTITPLAEEICTTLKKVDGVQEATISGSYRRGLATIGDIDILVISSKPKKVMDAFVSLPDIEKVLAHGERRSSIRLHNGLQVDTRVLQREQYGSALLYFTGSKEHNVAVRKLALRKGFSLSEYGLFTVKGKKLVVSATEEAVYKRLGMQYIPPEMREDRGEIELALKKKIPALVSWKDIRGDFQTQTKWSDGADSIADMAAYAEKLGLKFLVVTDHVGGIGIARPLDEKRLLQQAKEIDKVNKKSPVHIFKGAEIDIKKNGELALSKKACNELDVVLASVHSAFRMPQQEMTKRLCTALENNRVHIFGHPTGRLLMTREPIAFDAEKVFQTAKNNDVFLEVNGQPARMDLSDDLIHKAREIGCQFAISSDAHMKEQLLYTKYGVLNARRGWLEKKHVLNTKNVKEIEKVLRRR